MSKLGLAVEAIIWGGYENIPPYLKYKSAETYSEEEATSDNEAEYAGEDIF